MVRVAFGLLHHFLQQKLPAASFDAKKSVKECAPQRTRIKQENSKPRSEATSLMTILGLKRFAHHQV
jgi:hypothetical protein